MTKETMDTITQIAKDFAKGFTVVGEMAGSGWMIVDPLSGYLNFIGYENTLTQIPATEKNPLILIMTFKDGTQFIPAGSDLPHPGAKDWLWLKQ